MRTPKEIADHLLRHWKQTPDSEYIDATHNDKLPPLYPGEFRAMREQFIEDLREMLAEPVE